MKTTRKKSAIPAVKEEITKVPYTHKPKDMDVDEWQRRLRQQFGERQEFVLANVGNHQIFSDFRLTNPASGKTYRLAIRGDKPYLKIPLPEPDVVNSIVSGLQQLFKSFSKQ